MLESSMTETLVARPKPACLEQKPPKPLLDVTASQLHLGDCLDVLPTLPDTCIDLLLTDPPYGFFYRSRSRKLPLTTIANDRREAIPLLRKALRLVYPKLKENGVGLIFSNWQCYNSMAAVIEEEGFEIKNVLIWEKNAWSRGDLKGNWGYSYEMVIYIKKKKTPSKFRRYLSGRRQGNILKFSKLPANYMKHPTEKPVGLLKYLIDKSTLESEIVLDPFMGAGSTCVAAKQMNRNYIGIEIEPAWFEVAQARLQ
jgi:DNA modification methylase